MEDRTKPLILVVDDQATIIRIMSRILRPTYEVCVATNGRKALDVAREQLPDLILLDNMMPEMTGIETCMALKDMPETADIPVIFVTSMDDRHNEQMGFKAGAVDYMIKPPSQELVHARISVHLKNQRQRIFLGQLADGEITDVDLIQQGARHLLNI
ncbi:MAG: response regulator [Gammaproteobacteria bacterium]|nr:response regulator [Gammaproteobacteria bacterium]